MGVGLTMLLAVGLDRLLGEPRRAHPLAGFGRLAAWVEGLAYGPATAGRWSRRLRGLLALAALLAPLVLLATATRWLEWGWLLDAVILYLAIGHRSLAEHGRGVRRALEANDLAAARQRVGWMVSRDTAAMQPPDVAKAAVESVLENGNDAVFGALFWFAVAGAPGAVAYRLANTLDAMWGYRNARFFHFGWAAARLDDALNYVPARLTALSYALVGRIGPALACWRAQAPAWESPNAGPVMAAGAGALGLALGGGASYGGQWHERPALGAGRAATAADIGRAIDLVRRGVWLWLAVALFAEGLAHA